MVNHARDAKDSLGMMSLAWIHKKSPFYPDISYQEYKQHLTIVLLLPSEDRLELYEHTKNFTIGTLHQRLDNFGKGGEITSWAPPAFWKAAPGELVLITGSGSKTWGTLVQYQNVTMFPWPPGQLHLARHQRSQGAGPSGVRICIMHSHFMAISQLDG